MRDRNVVRTITFTEIPDGPQITRTQAMTNSDNWVMTESDHEEDDDFPPPIDESGASSAEPSSSSAPGDDVSPSTPMTGKAAGKRKARA